MANKKDNENVKNEKIKKGGTSSKKNGTGAKSSGVKKNAASLKNESKKSVSKNEVSKKDTLKKTSSETVKKNALKDSKTRTIEKARSEINSSSDNEFGKLIKIILIVTGIMLVFYGITILALNHKSSATKKTTQNAVIQYDKIMIGSMLNIEGSYYVLIEAEGDEHVSEYTNLMKSISANEDAPKIYEALLSDGFNSAYLADESNYDSDLSNFKVKGTCLVRISDNKIQDVYDDYDSINNKLKELE